jgi:hypothetical protein
MSNLEPNSRCIYSKIKKDNSESGSSYKTPTICNERFLHPVTTRYFEGLLVVIPMLIVEASNQFQVGSQKVRGQLLEAPNGLH